MKLVVGLGNPGEKYEGTRHNLGFRVVDELANQLMVNGKWLIDKKFKSEILEINLPSTINDKLLLIKPQTFMNNSGMAVRAIADYYKVPVEDIVVIHDELDLPLGKIKIRQGGAAAGHHGVESIIKALGDDKFIRVRLGIRPTEGKDEVISGEHKQASFSAEHFVLEPFTSKEKTKVKRLIKEATGAVALLLKEGLDKAQNQYN